MGVDGRGWKYLRMGGSGWKHCLVQPERKKLTRKSSSSFEENCFIFFKSIYFTAIYLPFSTIFFIGVF